MLSPTADGRAEMLQRLRKPADHEITDFTRFYVVLAFLTQLPDLISDGGGRGIPTTMVVQDRAQAVDRWGIHAAQSMWGAATLRMVLPGVTGQDEIREVARRIGARVRPVLDGAAQQQ